MAMAFFLIDDVSLYICDLKRAIHSNFWEMVLLTELLSIHLIRESERVKRLHNCVFAMWRCRGAVAVAVEQQQTSPWIISPSHPRLPTNNISIRTTAISRRTDDSISTIISPRLSNPVRFAVTSTSTERLSILSRYSTSLHQQCQAWQSSSCQREETRRTNREHITILWLLSCYRLTTDLQMHVSHTNNATFTAFYRQKALAPTTTLHRYSLYAMHPTPSPYAAADARRGRTTKDVIAFVQ